MSEAMNEWGQRFDDTKMYAAFKRIRNQIREYRPLEILKTGIVQLHILDEADVSQFGRWPPWFLFLLIKWTIIYGDFGSKDNKQFTGKDFDKLCRLFHDLWGEDRLPHHFDSLSIMLKTVAFQQFWFQEIPIHARLSRQSLLFGHHSNQDYFEREFQRLTGLTIAQFLEYSFMALSRFLPSDRNVDLAESWFSSVEASYPAGTARQYLRAVSRNLDETRAYLQGSKRYRSIAFEFVEQTPLKRFPFLQLGNNHVCYSRRLLFAAIQDYIYDALKANDAHSFMLEFGKVLEIYIKQALSLAKLQFLSEAELSRCLGQGKTVDFLIVEDNANILIDSKAVEMTYLGRVAGRADVIEGKTKSSALKGIQQAYDTLSRAATHKEVGGVTLGTKDNFLLVVTFKDLYIGNGKDFYENIAKDSINELVDHYRGKFWIPFENIYFISIDDFDMLIQSILAKRKRLTELLRYATEQDGNSRTKKFVFRQHILSEVDKLAPPPYLANEFTILARKCEDVLTHRLK